MWNSEIFAKFLVYLTSKFWCTCRGKLLMASHITMRRDAADYTIWVNCGNLHLKMNILNDCMIFP